MAWVLGPPGSGKSTQSKRLGKAFNFKVISLESCFEQAKDLRTGIAKQLEILYSSGKGQIPASLIASALRAVLEIHQRETELPPGTCKYRICLDGFPETREEATAIEKEIDKPHFVLSLQTPYKDAMARLTVLKDGSKVSADVKNRLSVRFKSFPETFQPVEDYYKAQGKLTKIKATAAETIMTVFNQMKILFSYMEADAIMAATEMGREILVVQPILHNKKNVIDARESITEMRNANAKLMKEESKDASKRKEAEVKADYETNYAHGRLIVDAEKNGTFRMPNCYINKSLRYEFNVQPRPCDR